MHYAQSATSGETNQSTSLKNKQMSLILGKFQQYDYGLTKNYEKYGRPTPPKYDLSKVTTPFAFYFAKNDWFLAVSVRPAVNFIFQNNNFFYRMPRRY